MTNFVTVTGSRLRNLENSPVLFGLLSKRSLRLSPFLGKDVEFSGIT